MKSVPQARVDIRSVDLGSEILIYDERHDLVHILNSTARQIWQLCDGSHDVVDIVDSVARLFPQVDPQRIRGDVERAIEDLVQKNIIIWCSGLVPDERESS